MINLLKNKTVLGGLAAAAVLMLGYFFWSSSGSDSLLTETGVVTSPISQEILTSLSQIKSIKLDPSIFDTPAFKSLASFGVDLPTQPAGRRNPFAPVGATTPPAEPQP